ncbi:hypothetical protein BFP97_15595 [Roseivirga sp. 4D4]|uniref:DegT/DnrJ/EryC1/StrS family aminotransferase n=1 Tax=Roseivirga sp. 4D4 TaxID=1889784 RepID=UPI000852C468|nr:DegT/DnrJ/EryC1/StrS family aminotransferase [Roseivirga sp. 4D4]OEK02859.1 hypothetical protein BFP97_15595 [Roseivirga sp. 4D4]
MQVPFLDLKRTHKLIQSELESTFTRVLEGSYFLHGEDVSSFEKAFGKEHEYAHCVSTGNCTDALQLTLQAIGIGSGDEVIVPAMTWITDAEVVSNLGATPIFVDVNASGLIDVNLLEGKLTPKTRAIIPVHLYGQMAEMETIMAFAKKHDLFVIEDCAQATFAQHQSKKAGTWGHAAVFSFYPTKNLGALGDAGCMLTQDADLAAKVRKLANHGAADKHSHEMPGSNSRMDTLQAAVLNLKLPYLEKWNEERREIATHYNEAFADLPISLPKMESDNIHTFHVYQVQTDRRDDLKAFLRDRGVQTQIHYPKAIPFTKAYSSLAYQAEDLPEAYRVQGQTISLPLFPGMTNTEKQYVIQSVREFFKK